MTQSGPQIKGEAKTYKKNQFNTTEGGLYCGHVMENNAKMAVALRRIFPSPFKRAQYIGLQQGGQLDGGILCSTPSTFQIVCGEAPVQDVAGVWYAENGDINIHAPKGRIRITAQTIDLISTGDGDKTGYVNVNANANFEVEATDVKMSADAKMSLAADSDIDINSTGKTQVDCGSWKVIEGGDFFQIPGTGNLTVEQHLKAMMKLVKSLT
tara:strand:+ start:180 stop:812 length:633 start_codon:yes stop_codon:yes gene_type:complete